MGSSNIFSWITHPEYRATSGEDYGRVPSLEASGSSER